jgi:hypothetical protein
MTMKRTALGLLLGASALAPSPAHAYGGFFGSQQQAVRQAGERVILADNGDGTITAVIEVSYAGPAQNFAWLLPIGNATDESELTMSSNAALWRLEAATRAEFFLDRSIDGICGAQLGSAEASTGQAPFDLRETCDANSDLAGCADYANIAATDSIEAIDWQVIRVDPGATDPATPAIEWLTANGYDVTPDGAAQLGSYLASGMNLLALRFTKDSSTGSIRPIQLTIPATSPMIPMVLTSVSADPDMPITAWVLSRARAVPDNYRALELNEARIDWFHSGNNYRDIVTRAANEAGGNGFVTEYARPAALLAGLVWTQREEEAWQGIRGATDASLEEILQMTYDLFHDYDGFGGALRGTVEIDPGLDLEDFRRCPSCYADLEDLSLSELFAAIDADVLQPLRSVQSLIDAAPYMTRLFTTLSAEEMTVDPVFSSNDDLAEVSRLHQARHVIECDIGNDVSFGSARWRIELPKGTTLRGLAYTNGVWPAALDAQPANIRVLALTETGTGEVVVDNSGLIGEMLDEYNASLPVRRAPEEREPAADSGSLCSLPSRGPGGTPAPFALGLAALLGTSGWRRRAQAPGSGTTWRSPPR